MMSCIYAAGYRERVEARMPIAPTTCHWLPNGRCLIATSEGPRNDIASRMAGRELRGDVLMMDPEHYRAALFRQACEAFCAARHHVNQHNVICLVDQQTLARVQRVARRLIAQPPPQIVPDQNTVMFWFFPVPLDDGLLCGYQLTPTTQYGFFVQHGGHVAVERRTLLDQWIVQLLYQGHDQQNLQRLRDDPDDTTEMVDADMGPIGLMDLRGDVDAWLAALPRAPEPPPRPRSRHQAVVDLYLQVSGALVRAAATQTRYREAALRIPDVTIYELDAGVLRHALTLIERSMGFSGPRDPRAVERARHAAPLDDERPFRHMWLGFYSPIALNSTVSLLALIVTGRQVLAAYRYHDDAVFSLLYDDGWICDELALAPWLIPWLLREIDQQSAAVVHNPVSRGRYRARARRYRVKGSTPPPYYVVDLARRVDQIERAGGGAPRNTEFEWRHRWTVEAHERAYVRRGPLPIDPQAKAAWLRRGYQVFEHHVDDRAGAALARRGKPAKRPGEWLAIRYVRIAEDIRPHRPDLPIVRSTRRPRITR